MSEFRARYRFRLGKKLNLSTKKHQLTLGIHSAELSPQEADKDIRDTDWLVINARGIRTKKTASHLARRIKGASELAALCARVGIDSGVDRPTAGIGASVREQARTQGTEIRDNVHGIDVFRDQGNV